mmetsp:Transcript_64414/g.185076  ORF Transcript_64414/g.185076 Transcript_64414/m.185076 type:complete len:231 (-) Transcript_64414:941-1633(-)
MPKARSRRRSAGSRIRSGGKGVARPRACSTRSTATRSRLGRPSLRGALETLPASATTTARAQSPPRTGAGTRTAVPAPASWRPLSRSSRPRPLPRPRSVPPRSRTSFGPPIASISPGVAARPLAPQTRSSPPACARSTAPRRCLGASGLGTPRAAAARQCSCRSPRLAPSPNRSIARAFRAAVFSPRGVWATAPASARATATRLCPRPVGAGIRIAAAARRLCRVLRLHP